MAPPRCMVVDGDVVRVQFPGDNGIIKPRYCVVIERVPNNYDPDAVLLIAGCSDTKRGSQPGRYERIFQDDEESDAFDRMNLDNSTTFHIEDIRGFDGKSPQLKKIGSCPGDEFRRLKRLAEMWIYEGNQIVVLPCNARAAARAAVEKRVTSAQVADE